MKKFKVEFTQTETFIVDVLAEDEEKARDKATGEFGDGNYQEIGDCETNISNVYDVTNTDDPFDGELAEEFDKLNK